MSVYDRIAGTLEPKVPVWPIMMDFTRVMDGEITIQQLAEIYQFNSDEMVEVGEYLTAIGAMVQAEVVTRIGIGWPQDSAIRDARVSVDAVLRYALLRTEQGTYSVKLFRSALGL